MPGSEEYQGVYPEILEYQGLLGEDFLGEYRQY
jgi:hypothetical protein